MSWQIATAGMLNLDYITTPHGHRDRLLGGSAYYFTLAARNFAQVHVHGIVGKDARDEFLATLQHPNVNFRGIQANERPTRTWTATHDFRRWVAVVEGDGGGFEAAWDDDWDRRLTGEGKRAQVLFVGAMSPAYQIDIIKQSKAKLVGCDFMTVFIQDEREGVLDVLAQSDVLFANHEELAVLAGGGRQYWQASAQRLIAENPRLRAVVVKAGPHGAALVTADSVTKRKAVDVPMVIDPTGAGDSLAGGFLGYCAQVGRSDDWTLQQALDHGLECAAKAISSFGTEGLITPHLSQGQSTVS